jgi:formate-dependent nitrite reductase membrane component NrfD
MQLFYVLGIGAGTFAGNLVFIYGGKYLSKAMGNSQQNLNIILGTAFLLTALLQGWKLYKPVKKEAD